MDLAQKIIGESMKINVALEAMGINIFYMRRAYPQDNPLQALAAVHMLFHFVHIDTEFGQKELPAMPPPHQYVAQAKTEFRKANGENHLFDQALDRYASDLVFRAELYALYKDGLLPAIRALEKY